MSLSKVAFAKSAAQTGAAIKKSNMVMTKFTELIYLS
jgi:hypothetical protein